MSDLTKRIISLLSASKTARYVVESHAEVGKEIYIYFTPTGRNLHRSIQPYNYVMPAEDFAMVDWPAINLALKYEVYNEN